MPPVPTPTVSQGGEKKLRGRQNMPSIRQYLELDQPAPSFVAVGETEKTGKGMFATRNIDPYTRIISEVPSIDLRTGWLSEANLKLAFDALPNDRKAAIMDLSFVATKENASPLTMIFDQNAMDARVGRVLCPTVARFNHSCLPNAFGNMNWLTNCYTIQALHDIEEGEEITISYMEVEYPKDERCAELKKIFGFDCVCSLCTTHFSAMALTRSNTRRAFLRQFRGLLTLFDPNKAPQDERTFASPTSVFGVTNIIRSPPPS